MNDDKQNLERSWLQRLVEPYGEPQSLEQLDALLQDALQRGLFGSDTLKMLQGALQVSNTHARDIMIPRAQMVVLAASGTPEDFLPVLIESGHSRFPVVGDSRDDVQGILLAKDLLAYYTRATPGKFDLRDVMRPPVFIPESKRLSVLLGEFRTSRNHMAIVVDEYGGVAGLVTIEDVIEEIVGEIDDEHDLDTEVYIKPQDNNAYSVRALTPVNDFNAHFASALNEQEADTVGGIVLKAFGHLPKCGESITLGDLYFEVLRSDKRRIHLLRVSRLTEKENPPEQT